MGRKRIAFALLLFTALLPSVSRAACNMGEDARNITEKYFGRLKLSGFSAGSLTVSGQHALPDADSWPFSLRPPNNEMRIEVAVPATANSLPLSLEGKMTISKPITGFILERITGDGCRRELRVKDNDLVGSNIVVKSGSVENSFGGKFILSGLKLQIAHQINLSDRKGQVRGALLFKGRDVKIIGSQIRLPGGDQLPTTVNFSSRPEQDVSFDISLEGSLATLHSAQIASENIAKPATSISPNWQDLLFVKQKGNSVVVEDLKLNPVQSGSQLSLKIAGIAPLPSAEQTKDVEPQKVVSCYANATAGNKSITIEQMHECAGVWVTPRVLLGCALRAHCSVLEDTIAGRAAFLTCQQTPCTCRRCPRRTVLNSVKRRRELNRTSRPASLRKWARNMNLSAHALMLPLMVSVLVVL
jgi:hypothetical protein